MRRLTSTIVGGIIAICLISRPSFAQFPPVFYHQETQLVDVGVYNVPIRTALDQLFVAVGKSYVISPQITGNVTVVLDEVPFDFALRSILRATMPGLQYHLDGTTYEIFRGNPDVAGSVALPNVNIVVNNCQSDQVLRTFLDKWGVKYVLDPAVSQSLVDAHLNNVSAVVALQTLLNDSNPPLTYVVNDGTLYIKPLARIGSYPVATGNGITPSSVKAYPVTSPDASGLSPVRAYPVTSPDASGLSPVRAYPVTSPDASGLSPVRAYPISQNVRWVPFSELATQSPATNYTSAATSQVASTNNDNSVLAGLIFLGLMALTVNNSINASTPSNPNGHNFTQSEENWSLVNQVYPNRESNH